MVAGRRTYLQLSVIDLMIFQSVMNAISFDAARHNLERAI